MPALFIALLVCAGTLWGAAWDIRAQCLIFSIDALILGAWMAAKTGAGSLPIPSRRVLIWCAALVALAWLSARLSPVAAYSMAGWRALILGLLIFPLMGALSQRDRRLIDESVRLAAWCAGLFAIYQILRRPYEPPASLFPNSNVMAAAALLWLGFAWEKRDWALGAALLLILAWDRSLGAWAGLAAALLLSPHLAKRARTVGFLLALVCLAALAVKIKSPETMHRWQWWAAAARMIRDKPLLGYGPSSFAYVFPAYRRAGQELASLYAHEHFLQTAAECGLPYLILWVLGLAHCLSQEASPKRLGALAALGQALVDYPLAVPAVFWLFCYCAAQAIPSSPRQVSVPARLRFPSLILAAAAALALSSWSWRQYRAEGMKSAAEEFMLQKEPQTQRAAALLEKSLALREDPEADALLARARIDIAAKSGGLTLLDAAAAQSFLQRSADLDPYRPSTWQALADLDRKFGDEAGAREALSRGAPYCPNLAAGTPAAAFK